MKLTTTIKHRLAIPTWGGISGFIIGTAVGTILGFIQNNEGFVPHWTTLEVVLLLPLFAWLSAFLYGIPAAFLGTIQGFAESFFGRLPKSIFIWPLLVGAIFYFGNLLRMHQQDPFSAVLFGFIASLIAWSISYISATTTKTISVQILGYGIFTILIMYFVPLLWQLTSLVLDD